MIKAELENRKLERKAKEWLIKDKGGSIIQSLVNLIKEFTEPREKQIQIDAEQIRALQKQNGELTDKVKELEAQIEKMKCCGNCKYSYCSTSSTIEKDGKVFLHKWNEEKRAYCDCGNGEGKKYQLWEIIEK